MFTKGIRALCPLSSQAGCSSTSNTTSPCSNAGGRSYWGGRQLAVVVAEGASVARKAVRQSCAGACVRSCKR